VARSGLLNPQSPDRCIGFPAGHGSEAVRTEGLFQGAVKRGELGIDPGFDSGDGDENSKRNACGDQAVFNGRCGGLVRNEPESGVHGWTVSLLTRATVPGRTVETNSITEACA
jgi:hypothetical protein